MVCLESKFRPIGIGRLDGEGKLLVSYVFHAARDPFGSHEVGSAHLCRQRFADLTSSAVTSPHFG